MENHQYACSTLKKYHLAVAGLGALGVTAAAPASSAEAQSVVGLVESGLPEEASKAVVAFNLGVPVQDVVKSPADLAAVGEQLTDWVKTPESENYSTMFTPNEMGIVDLFNPGLLRQWRCRGRKPGAAAIR